MLTKVCLVKAMVFPVVMYICEGWTIKKAEYQRIDTFPQWCWRRLLRVPWTASRSNQSINPKGNQSWIFTRRTDAEAEVSIVEPNDVKSRFIRRDPDAGKDWRQEEKGTAEDEMIGWYHWLDGHEFELGPGVSDEQRSLHAAVHGFTKSRTQLSNWTEPNWTEIWMIQSLDSLFGSGICQFCDFGQVVQPSIIQFTHH